MAEEFKFQDPARVKVVLLRVVIFITTQGVTNETSSFIETVTDATM